MKIEVFKAVNGNWYVRLRANNGQKITVSESYSNKSNAKRAARSIRFQTLFAKVVVIE